MTTYEFQGDVEKTLALSSGVGLGKDATSTARTTKNEPIITFKVYDSARYQDCLRGTELGPCFAAEDTTIDGETVHEGEIIPIPAGAATANVFRLKVSDSRIVSKEPSQFKKGFWDIGVEYVFEYGIVFRESDGSDIVSAKAKSVYLKKVSLFGSVGSELTIATDLISVTPSNSTSAKMQGEPFVFIESKAVALSAEIRYGRHHDRRPRLEITVGLFSIITLFRLVYLVVESRGFYIPSEKSDMSPINPCDFFDQLDFPMDIFAPPQKPEFLAGVSANIPADKPQPRKPDPCDPCAGERRRRRYEYCD